MVKALAPRWFLRDSWGVYALALGIIFAATSSLHAQTDAAAKKGEPAKKAAGAAPAAAGLGEPDDEADIAKKPEGQGVVNSLEIKKQESVELFKDPRSEKANTGTFPELAYPPARTLTAPELAQLKSMASGLTAPDRAFISKAVDIQAAELTNRTNIKFVIDPPPPPPGTKPGAAPRAVERAIEKASQLLIELLATAKEKKNDAFLTLYVPILFQKLTPLLSNHLIPRVQAAIILGKAGNPAQVDLFIKQIADPNQVVWVKLWSAVGISNATNDGKVTLDVVKATAATAALVGFLKKEPTAPWPVKVRAIEALGNLRLPSISSPPGKPETTATLMTLLADPANKYEVRAWSAWALGMIQMTPSQKYNFSIEAYYIGKLAAKMGEKIGQEFDLNEKDFGKRSDYARYLTGLMLYQLSPALSGESDLQFSGLVNMRHPDAAAASKFSKELDDNLKNLIQESIDLLRAGGTEMAVARKNVGKRVVELNAFVDKNRPKVVELYPGGPKFPIAAAAEVADAPAPKPAK